MTPSNFQYTILSGDTLSTVAYEINACHGVTTPQIENANPNIHFATLQVGQVIDIPAIAPTKKGLRYTIRPGDNLANITAAINAINGISYQEIEEANPGINPSQLQVGQLVNIPSSSTPLSPPKESPQTGTAHLSATNIGYWHWTYHSSIAPEGTTMGMAFFGATDPAIAIKNSEKVKGLLKGDKYICLGGGTSEGRYTAEAIAKIVGAIKAGDFAGYQGIAFDVEVGDSGLSADFKNLFAITKANQLKTLVTISHSRPYGIKDGTALMRSFLTDENIDFISPQLYTTGKETANQYDAYGVKWSEYGASKGAVIPSIVKASYYNDALNYFKKVGVELKGYVQWHQA